ncbi:MAG: aldo/keto reductase, partial [bacterium]
SGETLRAKTDEYSKKIYNYDDQDFAILERVLEVARYHGVKPIQVALAWVLHQPGITAPIVGTGKIEQLQEMATALEIKLTEEELKQLQEPYKPRSLRGHE